MSDYLTELLADAEVSTPALDRSLRMAMQMGSRKEKAGLVQRRRAANGRLCQPDPHPEQWHPRVRFPGGDV